MMKRVFTFFGTFLLACIVHAEAKVLTTPKDELYERLDTSSLFNRDSLNKELGQFVKKSNLTDELQSYINERKDSPGAGLALDLLLSTVESEQGGLGLLGLAIKASDQIQNAALDLFFKNFEQSKYRGLSLQKQATSFRHKLTLKMLERSGEKTELASATANFLESQLTAENAQLFILPLPSKSPGFKTGLSVLVRVLSRAERFGELTDLMFDTRADFRLAAFQAIFQTLNNQKSVVTAIQQSNPVEKKRLVGRLLDFADAENAKELGKILSTVDVNKDIEITLRDFDRTRIGALTAADAIVQLRMKTGIDTQKEVLKLMKDENPYIRKFAEQYSQQSAL